MNIDELYMEAYMKDKVIDIVSNLTPKVTKEDIKSLDLTNKGEIIGFSIYCFSTVLFRIKTNMKNIYRVEIVNYDTYEATDYQDIISYSTDNTGVIRVDLPKEEKIVLDYLEYASVDLTSALEKIINNQSNFVTFGCCSRYVECSDARKCTNPDSKFSKGCIYKKNLEQGKVFYGKNRNI